MATPVPRAATAFQRPATCPQPPATCLQSSATRPQPPATCPQPPATCLQSPATWPESPATCSESPATCIGLPATCFRSLATCLLLSATWSRPPATQHRVRVARHSARLRSRLGEERVGRGGFRRAECLGFGVEPVPSVASAPPNRLAPLERSPSGFVGNLHHGRSALAAPSARPDSVCGGVMVTFARWTWRRSKTSTIAAIRLKR